MRLQRVGDGMSPGHGVRPRRKLYQMLYFCAPPLQL